MITTSWFLNPYLLVGLGTIQFAIWKSTQKLIEIACGFDGGAVQGLKWYTASSSISGSNDHNYNYYLIARNTLLRWLPVLLSLVSLIAVYVVITNQEIKTDKKITILFAILVTGVFSVLGLFAQLYESIAIGLGFGYKTIQIRGFWLLISSLLIGIVANSNWGILGVSIVFSLNILITSIALVRLTKSISVQHSTSLNEKNHDFRSYGRKILVWEFAQRYLISWELILLTVCGLTQQISAYVFSTFIFQFGLAATMQTVSAITPKISSIYLESEPKEIRTILEKIRKLTLFIALNVMFIMIFFNERVVSFWVGGDFYLGKSMNIYFVFCFLQLVLIRVDSQLLESTREVRQRMISSVLVLSIGSLLSFSSYYFTNSIFISFALLILSRSILVVYFCKLTSQHFKGGMWNVGDLAASLGLSILAIFQSNFLSLSFYLEFLGFLILSFLSGILLFRKLLAEYIRTHKGYENGN
jgi:O-antigen/teichoic acid export membrane protein